MGSSTAFDLGDGPMARGNKPTRSETVTVRLDPKLRYWADLGARKQRRTVSSFIEWAIEAALDRVDLAPGFEHPITLKDVCEDLWDIEEADRLAKLALRHPDLLTHTEQVIWKVVREAPGLWRGRWIPDGDVERWKWDIKAEGLLFDRLREHWGALREIAAGGATISALPSYIVNKTRPAKKVTPPPPTDSDDIPF